MLCGQLASSGKVQRLFSAAPGTYPVGMARSLYNWTHQDVCEFLEQKGFSFFDDVEGIGKAWMNFHENGEPNRIVEMKFTHGLYKPRALKRMIRQSGIPEEEWLKWTGA